MSRARIVSLLAAGTEILYALGLGERVIAVSHECDYPLDATLKPRVTSTRVNDKVESKQIDRQVHELVAQGAPLYEIDVDRLVSLAPDLIVTQAQCEVCAVNEDALRRALDQHGILESIAIVTLNPESLEGVLEDIRHVGEASGCQDAARTYVTGLRNRVDAVESRTDSLSPDDRPRVVCLEWIEPPMAAANWMPTLVKIAGGRNGLTTSGQRSRPTKWEDVVAFDPEIVVAMPCGFPLSRTVSEARRLESFPHWFDLAAARNQRVYAVDGNAYFNRSGPRIVDSLELLAGLIHPDRFESSLETYAGMWQRI